MDRKLISKKDLLIIVLLLALALAVYAVPKLVGGGDAVYAVITRDGEIVEEIPLDADGEYTVGNMVFTVDGGEIFVSESSCGDKICVRTGKISRQGEAIVCVPNRTAVTVESAENNDDLDVVLK